MQYAATGILSVLFDQRLDLVFRQIGEDFNVAFGLFVAHVEPELVERIGRRAMAIEPNIALLRLAEFLTVGFGNQRASEGKGFVLTAEFSTDQFRTGRDVPHWSLPPICRRQPFVS